MRHHVIPAGWVTVADCNVVWLSLNYRASFNIHKETEYMEMEAAVCHPNNDESAHHITCSTTEYHAITSF